MVISNSSDKGQSDEYPRPRLDNLVVIPFPIHPRQILYGETAKVLDFVDWKQCHILKADGKNDHGEESKSIEELEKLSIAEQQIWVIRELLKIYDSGGWEELHKLYEILCNKLPDSA